MNRQQLLAVAAIVVVMGLSSCSGGKDKAAREQKKDVPAASEKAAGAAGTQQGAAAAPAKKLTAAELVSSLPCKLEGKSGVFAVFPDNTAPGQACFSLYPALKDKPEISQFDIQNGGVYFVFHNTSGNEPDAAQIMLWEERGGKPCIDPACGKEIASRKENFSAPGESGWVYTVIAPEKFVDMSAVGGYTGLVKGPSRYIPLFK